MRILTIAVNLVFALIFYVMALFGIIAHAANTSDMCDYIQSTGVGLPKGFDWRSQLESIGDVHFYYMLLAYFGTFVCLFNISICIGLTKKKDSKRAISELNDPVCE
jgi:hypothetical protein